MEEKLYELDHYRLHTLYNKKYKKSSIEIHLRESLTHELYKIRTAAICLMARGTKKYNTVQELNKRKEYLYGLQTSCYAKSSGNILDTTIAIDFLNPKYVDEKSYLDEVLEFIFDYINNPELDESELERLKEEFILNFKKREENVAIKATKGAKKTLTGPITIDYFDSIEEIESITVEEIKESIKSLIKDTTVDIYVFGDLDMDYMKSKIDEYVPFKENTINKLEFDSFVEPRKCIDKEENGKFEQSHIIYYYSLKDMNRDSRIYALSVLGEVLGGGLNSLLYKDIREKHSLCYTLGAYPIRHFDLFQISVGVDKTNIDKTKERIEYVMSNLDTLITEEKVNDAILNIINGIMTNIDDSDYLIYEADTSFLNILDPRETKLENFKNVTLEDVKSLIPKIELYTRYVLVGDKNE